MIERMTEITLPVLLKVENLKTTGISNPVNLTVVSGQVWMISGSSGTGKSQSLKALADLIVHEGQVTLNGVNQQMIRPESWRSQVMYFSAETAWWCDSIAAHFDKIPDEEQLESIGLSPSILQKNPDECSSGEKQRLALLRGLARSPKILLLDEITANLDTEAAMKVEQLLQHYLRDNSLGGTRQGAIIWVSHDVAQRERMAPIEQQLIFKNVSETPLEEYLT